jgi:hypothetical protein
MDPEILRHAEIAHKHLRAAEDRARFVLASRQPPLRERVLLDDAVTALENFLGSPHSERD